MLPTMIPQIHFYDNARKCFRITYYEKNNMQYAYYSYNTLVASTHQNGNWNTYTRYHIDPNSNMYSVTTAKHIKEMLGLNKKQYRKEWERSQERQKKLETTPNCRIDTYHEVLYVVSDLFVPFGSTDVRSFAEEFLWATQTFFGEQDLVNRMEDKLAEIGAEPGDINNYIWALYQTIEDEIWDTLENIEEERLVSILRDNEWEEMAKQVEHLSAIDELDSTIEDMIERRKNDQAYNINCCASSFDWEPLDQSFRSENYDQTLARVFEGAYRQYIDENYDGVCDADQDNTEEPSTTES